MKREFSLPSWLEKIVHDGLISLKISLDDSKKIANSILKMSDFYIAEPSSPTPWKEPWCQIAQIAYFLPLNFLRSQSVFLEAEARKFPWRQDELLDYGSGLGAGSLPWLQAFDGDRVYVEKSPEAQKLHQKILQPEKRSHWLLEKNINPKKNRTALFSYSLTENISLPSWIYECESLIWIEPSTRDDGRRLLQRRKELLSEGFSMWAPCPHQQACPMLENSKTDWCHDRILIQMPDWFLEIEKHLPMKNFNLTFSYLLASRQPAPVIQQWRTVGDPLPEKGKTRQQICRGPEREFLSWLHRSGRVPEIPRGVLIEPIKNFVPKGSELRVSEES
jgi:hypothetical protein